MTRFTRFIDSIVHHRSNDSSTNIPIDELLAVAIIRCVIDRNILHINFNDCLLSSSIKNNNNNYNKQRNRIRNWKLNLSRRKMNGEPYESRSKILWLMYYLRNLPRSIVYKHVLSRCVKSIKETVKKEKKSMNRQFDDKKFFRIAMRPKYSNIVSTIGINLFYFSTVIKLKNSIRIIYLQLVHLRRFVCQVYILDIFS